MEFSSFSAMMSRAVAELKAWGQEVDAGRWQGVPTAGKPDLTTVELLDWTAEVPVDRRGRTFHEGFTLTDLLAQEIEPNREWADEHFAERIGGLPLNPDPSHERWPHWRGQDSTTKEDGKFSHTYSERFWPRYAGDNMRGRGAGGLRGIRYTLGDYEHLISLMANEPHGRQAYLPIFFPEDTGAVHGGRIPCTLGYHFMLRRGQLHMWYDIRSCDLYRHLRDDVYLAVLLMLHTIEKLRPLHTAWASAKPGTLYFKAHSLHIHKGDWHHVYSH